MSDWGLLDPLASIASAAVDDDAVLTALIQVEAALVSSWDDCGFAPDWVRSIDLSRVRVDRDAIARGNRAGGNPVIPLLSQLREHVDATRPGASDWVHRGATSQDIMDTAIMLVASRAISIVEANLLAASDSLAASAEGHRHDLMVGRTLSQHAAPITFGVKLASWLDGVDAARDALSAARPPVQLAGSVGTGSAFATLSGTANGPSRLRAAFAARLGLSDPERSWQAERSPVAQLASGLAFTIGALGRIATDLLVLSRTEVGEVSGAQSGTSSAMPQKQNPTAVVLVRSAALRSPGLLSTLYAAVLTEDERPTGAWHSEWAALRALLRLAIESSEAMAAVLADLQVNTERMVANLDSHGGLAWSEHALSQLTVELGRVEATTIVARAIAQTGGETTFAVALMTELDGRVIDLSPESIFLATDPVVDAAIRRHHARSAP